MKNKAMKKIKKGTAKKAEEPSSTPLSLSSLKHFDIKKDLHYIIIGIFLIYFFIKASYFALNVGLGIPPDELDHFDLTMSYYESGHWFIPDSEISVYHAEMNRNSPLYYILMGKLLNLNFFHITDYIFLRFLNILLSIIYLIYFIKLTELFTKNLFLIALTFIIQTNIMMFTFLFSSISYDNLLNLISILLSYYFIKHLATRKFEDLLLAIFFGLLGTLTKRTILPLAAIIFLIFIFEYYKQIPLLKAMVSGIFKKRSSGVYIILACLLLAISGNVLLYGSNLIKYKALLVKGSKMVSEKAYLESSPNAVVYQNLRKKKEMEKPTLMSPLQYFPQWNRYILQKTLGIMGHKVVYHNSSQLSFFLYAFWTCTGLMILMFIIFFKKIPKEVKYALIIVLFYFLVLCFFVNYKAYMSNGYILGALQGRYVFPFLPFYIVLFVKLLFDYLPSKVRIIPLLVIAPFFIYFEFPYYLSADRSHFEEKFDLHPMSSYMENGTVSYRLIAKELKRHPDNKEPWYYLVNYYQKENQFDSANKYLNVLIQSGTKPKFISDFYINFGVFWASKGEIDSAIKYTKSSIEENNANFTAYKNLGIFYNKTKQYDSATIAFDDYLSLNPKDNDVLKQQLRYFLFFKKDYKTAENYVNKLKRNGVKPDRKWMELLEQQKN